ncbi:MAG: DUF2950 domain-containing protein [Planctomycetota bacterium]
MRPNQTRSRQLGLLLALLALVALVPTALAEGPPTFDLPNEAAQALIQAARANDDAALAKLIGTESADIVASGSDPAVAAARAAFVAKADEALAFETDGEDRVIIVVGEDQWPLPIPLVKGEGGWTFDAESAREEILARRIGRNELEAIDLLKAYVAAQREYASQDRDGDEVREFAQRLLSSPGKRDGLYWESEDDPSPLGARVTPFRDFVTQGSRAAPWNGYYWMILKGQGRNAPGGAHSYVINGNMIAGFALVAVPADYDSTGVMSFLVSHHGKILEKDLGPDGINVVRAMTSYNPDSSWTEVTDE